jgi:hypothetical protein
MPENWVDITKQYYLWEGQRGGGLELMLQRTDTNSRVNEEMARWIMALGGITHNWKGKYKDMWGDSFIQVQNMYLILDAFSRDQAIQLAAAVAKASAPVMAGASPPEEKRGGLLGLFRR